MSHSRENFTAAFPAIVSEPYRDALIGKGFAIFPYIGLIRLITAITNVSKCVDDNLDRCLDRVLTASTASSGPQQIRRLYSKFNQTNYLTVQCEASRDLCRRGTSEEWQGWESRKHYVRPMHEDSINEWLILKAVYDSKVYVSKIHGWTSTSGGASPRALTALHFKVLTLNGQWPVVQRHIEASLSRLRLLKPGGRVFLGFSQPDLTSLDENCISPLLVKYRMIMNINIRWPDFLIAIEALRAADELCKLPAMDGATARYEIASDKKDLILPLWMFNVICNTKSKFEQCRQTITASVIANRFVQVYEVHENKLSPYRRE